ncbi:MULTISPECIES: type 1 glutamine amidotransferase domain-containing protein [unclassified Streptomyces]|uniref:type 1 glutamine amidotransferase domain-containing protein n=1 Tax=unclassified Streptomyces TaxID=2593676 RepID=UPI002DD80013|nr:type 1 glutamine amidotransferase domain-containing protein [Streptomyces sp. NBC_00243]WRZ17562.1 type 1 glutamine amidotransferase domain-containing protein [Streptomyces sp. NBC_00243]
MGKILFVMTKAGHLTLNDGTLHPTGFWAEEFAAPYRAVTEAGHEVVVATPGGAAPTVDPASLAPEFNGGEEGAEAVAALLDQAAVLRRPIALADVDPADYLAVFYPGGHGPMEDLSTDADSARLITATLDAGRPLALVCHGVAALLATEQPDGTSPLGGYRVTGFTNAEEAQSGLGDKVKWRLQDRLVALGVEYTEGEPWASYVVSDRNLITGQNPGSSAELATALLKTLA